MIRPSTLLAALLLPLVGGWLYLFAVHPALTAARHAERRIAGRTLVRKLGLTDLALFTEARYTRHPSQADRFAPFQDHPMALDHFPSGGMIPPPEMRKGRHAQDDGMPDGTTDGVD
ncbi:MAG: hypothetical protein ACLFRG_04080 [Desulfococcaceae bacterium]